MPKKTKTIKVGDVLIGGGNPIVIQSMTKTSTKNAPATIKQINELKKAGCQLVRLAIKDIIDTKALRQIKAKTKIPLVADIHFDYQLALAAIESGVDKIRLNPGNINDKQQLKEIIEACKSNNVAVRIGINAGSLEKDILKKYKKATAKALVESGLRNIKLIEKFSFRDIVVSLKSSSVPITIEAYQLISQKTDYPLHVGITEAGIGEPGIIKSSVGIGSLLSQEIGDTIRVSLTDDPVKEVWVAKEILKSLELIKEGVTVIACPMCGRCQIDVAAIAQEVYDKTRNIKTPMKVAIMGCEVNGPGEAREADIALIGGAKEAALIINGKFVKNIPFKNIVQELIQQIKNYA
ncbi:MAG: flavodoxin-dependent (E)-4-hydroxy-3-methylbut-2-enyl-diphosphate synthase [Candidatus Buchananbacteria bacterium]|nr:flavodoxin-dependent (E)-4-hydroxy-3-methylbut-2-enyl-diphosphate synthase [Candidatus Buchananbacteria bacterium]